jgi:hypothetical protein
VILVTAVPVLGCLENILIPFRWNVKGFSRFVGRTNGAGRTRHYFLLFGENSPPIPSLPAPVCPPICPPYEEKEPAEAGSFSLPQKPRRVRGAHAANQIKSVFSGGVDF